MDIDGLPHFWGDGQLAARSIDDNQGDSEVSPGSRRMANGSLQSLRGLLTTIAVGVAEPFGRWIGLGILAAFSQNSTFHDFF
jgi:hypothetical protein